MSSSTTPIGNHAENNTTTTVQPPTAQNSAFEGMLPKVAGGAPARIYLNENITPYLLEGLKNIVREQPSNPLKVLGEYLVKKSDELEQKQNEDQ